MPTTKTLTLKTLQAGLKRANKHLAAHGKSEGGLSPLTKLSEGESLSWDAKAVIVESASKKMTGINSQGGRSYNEDAFCAQEFTIDNANPLDLAKALAANDQYLAAQTKRDRGVGSTSAACIANSQYVVSSVLGDSGAVALYKLNGKWKVQKLTRVHKPGDEDEAARIREAGGVVTHNYWDGGVSRVGGQLACARAFGDHDIRGVSDKSDLSLFIFPEEAKERQLFVYSDGISDVIPEADFGEVWSKASEYKDPVQVFMAVWREKSPRRTADNATLVHVALDSNMSDQFTAVAVHDGHAGKSVANNITKKRMGNLATQIQNRSDLTVTSQGSAVVVEAKDHYSECAQKKFEKVEVVDENSKGKDAATTSTTTAHLNVQPVDNTQHLKLIASVLKVTDYYLDTQLGKDLAAKSAIAPNPKNKRGHTKNLLQLRDDMLQLFVTLSGSNAAVSLIELQAHVIDCAHAIEENNWGGKHSRLVGTLKELAGLKVVGAVKLFNNTSTAIQFNNKSECVAYAKQHILHQIKACLMNYEAHCSHRLFVTTKPAKVASLNGLKAAVDAALSAKSSIQSQPEFLDWCVRVFQDQLCKTGALDPVYQQGAFNQRVLQPVGRLFDGLRPREQDPQFEDRLRTVTLPSP